MSDDDSRGQAAAFGGPGWSPRKTTLRQELGTLWGVCGVADEWSPLRAVLLHAPGPELDGVSDPNAAQMLAPLDSALARRQHEALARAYADAGVTVHSVAPNGTPPPNLMFVADLMFMTPEGAIIARPASTVRAGEERWVAERLAALGIPIVRTLRGDATFEGADAIWLDDKTVLSGTGLRTNRAGFEQLESTLAEQGVETLHTLIPHTPMHLMGALRIVDRETAIVWNGQLPETTVATLKDRGFRVVYGPSERETTETMALNFVTLGPRRILMPTGNPVTQAFFEAQGITCATVDISELRKAAGAIGCMSGILQRGAS